MLLKKFLTLTLSTVFLLSGLISSAVAAPSPLLTVQVLTRPTVSVPIGAQHVPMLTLQMTASCSRDVSLSSITFRHRGLGNAADIERVYGVSGGVRRSRAVALSGRDGMATLQLRGFTIPSCSTVSMEIQADVRSTAAAAGEHGLEIADAQNIVTDPYVPVALNLAGVLGLTVPVGNVIGAVTADLLDLPSTLSYGSARTVARLRLKAIREDQQITSITFTNDGTARGADLQNLLLETSGHTRLSATVPSLDGNRVTVIIDPPLALARNEVRLVQLIGDVRASRRKTVKLIIQEPSDIHASPVR